MASRGVAVVITGDKYANALLRQLSSIKEQKEATRKAARISMKALLPVVRKNTPKDSGALRRSWTVRSLTGNRRRVGARITNRTGHLFKGKQFYGAFQEWGWKVGKRRFFSRDPNRSEIQEHERRKIPGKFFLKGSADAQRKRILAIYSQEIKRLVYEIARRNGAR